MNWYEFELVPTWGHWLKLELVNFNLMPQVSIFYQLCLPAPVSTFQGRGAVKHSG